MKDLGKPLDELFATMRFNIEGDLIELNKLYPDLPECPSQRHRALRALEFVGDSIKATRGLEYSHRKLLRRYEQRLEDFLAVHRTVCILEHTLVDHWMTEEEIQQRAMDQNQETP